MLFLIGLLFVVALIGLAALGYGASTAVRVGFFATLIVPTWLVRGFGAIEVDLRLIVVIMVFPISYIAGRHIRFVTWVDGLFATLLAVGLYSLYASGFMSVATLLGLFTGTMVPYAFGRLLVRSVDDLSSLVPYVAAACLILASLALFEAVSHINPLNRLAGRIGSFVSEEGPRFGLRRADGVVGHPIVFGMMFAMMFPWALEGARRAMRNELPKFYLAVPLCCVVGVICTVSRGPFLAMLATLYAGFFFWQPKLRVPLIAAAVAGALVVAIGWSSVVSGLEDISGERSEINVAIGDQIYPYTGTRHRQLLYLVYADAMSSAGWFGHGHWGADLSHLVYLEPDLRQLFRSIDNHYILLILNGGIFGLLVFIVTGVGSLLGGAWTALRTRSSCGPLLGAMVGAYGSVMLLLTAVWMAPGFGFFWMAGLGMLSSCVGSYRASLNAPEIIKPAGADSASAFAWKAARRGDSSSPGSERPYVPSGKTVVTKNISIQPMASHQAVSTAKL